MAPKVKIPSIIECHSESSLREELERTRASLLLAETEETWDTISNALLRMIALSKGGACDFPTTLTSSIRSMYRAITSAAASERSRLSATALECIASLAVGLGPSFDPLVPLFIPTLLSLCSRPNKVFISRAKATIQTIIDQTQLISLLPFFVGALRDKSVTLRLIAIETLLACVQCFNPPDLEKDSRARDVENAIRLTATDASADVRRVSRQVFDAYKILLPARVESFAAPLSPIMKKYLNIDIPSGDSRPQSSQSTYTATRPTSSLMSGPPKREELPPRPATSMAHHRSASSSRLATTKSSAAIASKFTRSETKPIIAPPHGQSAVEPSSKRKDDMPPPAIVPQRRPQVPSGPQIPLKHPGPMGRPEPKVAERPPEASTSIIATHILRPESTQPSAPLLKSHAGPQRVEAMTSKERLLGEAQRILLPETQQRPGPPKPLLAHQEKKVSADAQAVPMRSRLDSVRHGPKSSAAMSAKRAVAQTTATSSTSSKRTEISLPLLAEEDKEVPIPATEGKKAKPKSSSGKGKGIGTKIPDGATGGKKEVQKAGASAPDRPKSSMTTHSTSQSGAGVKPRKKDDPEGARPVARKPSQSAKGIAATQPRHPKKVAARIGGPMQPTLSQLARMKAAEEEKAHRVVAKGSTKPLTIRPKSKAIPPKVDSKEVEIPAAAITTPLPSSPEVRPADVPLPASPVSVLLAPAGGQHGHVAVLLATDAGSNITAHGHPPAPTPARVKTAHPFGTGMATKTPISALVNSIQRGFLLSPNSPLSPALPDAEWECPAWPGLAINVGEEPSFEGVAESTVKRPLAVVGSDPERRALVDMN